MRPEARAPSYDYTQVDHQTNNHHPHHPHPHHEALPYRGFARSREAMPDHVALPDLARLCPRSVLVVVVVGVVVVVVGVVVVVVGVVCC